MKTMIRSVMQSGGGLPRRSVLRLPAALCAIGVLCTLCNADVHGAWAAQAPIPATGSDAPARKHIRHNQKEELYFERRYGISQLNVHSLSAGASLEFRCQVLDAEKASALKDNRAAPIMIDRKTGKKMSVPAADGKPHQSVAPEAGQEYWVVFGNATRSSSPAILLTSWSARSTCQA